MRMFAKLTGGRERKLRVPCSREGRATTRPPVSVIPRELEAAIEAADLALREPNDDGERIVVFCTTLGGAFIYSKEEAERRIMLKFPTLPLENVAAAAGFLESHVRLFLKPIQNTNRRKSSWTHGWRGDY